jgi:hypothetical protein
VQVSVSLAFSLSRDPSSPKCAVFFRNSRRLPTWIEYYCD